jgi:hypothetical protein
MKLGNLKSLFKTLKEPKSPESVFLLRKHNKELFKHNANICYYLNIKPTLNNMKSLNMVLPENVKKLGGE